MKLAIIVGFLAYFCSVLSSLLSEQILMQYNCQDCLKEIQNPLMVNDVDLLITGMLNVKYGKVVDWDVMRISNGDDIFIKESLLQVAKVLSETSAQHSLHLPLLFHFYRTIARCICILPWRKDFHKSFKSLNTEEILGKSLSHDIKGYIFNLGERDKYLGRLRKNIREILKKSPSFAGVLLTIALSENIDFLKDQNILSHSVMSDQAFLRGILLGYLVFKPKHFPISMIQVINTIDDIPLLIEVLNLNAFGLNPGNRVKKYIIDRISEWEAKMMDAQENIIFEGFSQINGALLGKELLNYVYQNYQTKIWMIPNARWNLLWDQLKIGDQLKLLSDGVDRQIYAQKLTWEQINKLPHQALSQINLNEYSPKLIAKLTTDTILRYVYSASAPMSTKHWAKVSDESMMFIFKACLMNSLAESQGNIVFYKVIPPKGEKMVERFMEKLNGHILPLHLWRQFLLTSIDTPLDIQNVVNMKCFAATRSRKCPTPSALFDLL